MDGDVELGINYLKGNGRNGRVGLLLREEREKSVKFARLTDGGDTLNLLSRQAHDGLEDLRGNNKIVYADFLVHARVPS